ncbi:hypothetical protein [Heliophilum fasciatum]|uniref:Uncharacterized protein n=1 Tax=Heliophilum fasciatum TaxID=35700 RepID=A0A4R2RCM5_9FIRM|nr:hypothetical protein [Heliophilum fasciatum]MCW2279406.1 hypothetical protein [Heliophilum fasciatum]TCP59998.1 hypothetical protein EDD73_14311 [Heliophilum fasciatum]
MYIDDLFVNEVVSNEENRFNLAFIHLLMITPFKRFVLDKLDLPEGTIIYSPKSKNGLRPDFACKYNGEIIAYVEVELGPKVQIQLENYKKAFNPVRIFSITTDDDSEITIEEIKNKLHDIYISLHEQERVSAQYAIDILKQYSNPDRYSRQEPILDNHQELNPIFNKFFEIGLTVSTKTSDNPDIYLDTVKEKGLSFRIRVNGKWVTLFNRKNGGDCLNFETKEQYYEKLEVKGIDVCEKWIRDVEGLTNNNDRLFDNGRNKYLKIPISIICEKNDALANAILLLLGKEMK